MTGTEDVQAAMTPPPIPANPKVAISQPLLMRIERELGSTILDIEAVAKTQERPMQLALAMIRRNVADVMARVTPYTGDDVDLYADKVTIGEFEPDPLRPIKQTDDGWDFEGRPPGEIMDAARLMFDPRRDGGPEPGDET